MMQRAQTDEGFTLVEVIAAIVVFGLVAAMGLAMLLASIRGGLVAKMDTVGRNLTQAKIEELRNLPFHIDQQVSSTEPDLLDLYYPNLTVTSTTGTTGYVSASATSSSVRSTADGDPSSGAFYRTVINPVPGYSKYKEYVTVQFVSTSRAPVDPQSTWSASTAGSDQPVANQVNVSVTTFWNAGTAAKKYNIFTEISGGRPLTPKVTLQGHVAALNVTGILPDGAQGTLDVGDLDFAASFSNIVTASATALGARAKVEGGSTASGALTSLLAPPNAGPVGTTAAGASVGDNGAVARFANTDTQNVSVGSASGQPYAGSSTSPITAHLVGTGGDGSNSAHYTDQPSNSHLGLSSDSWILQVTDASPTANPSVTAQGYGSSTSTSAAHSVSSNISSLGTTWIQLFPTSWAPNGIVQIEVTQASLNCTSGANYGTGQTSTASSTLTYAGAVKYATWNNGSVTYQTINLGSGDAADPLTPALLANTVVGVDASTGSNIYLGDYIASWSSLTSGQIGAPPALQPSGDQKSIGANYSGLITINSQALRTGDPTSTVGITVGALSCSVVDDR